MEEATFLTKFAGTVHLVHRRDQFRASKIMQERALSSEKIRIHYSHELESITGDQKVQQVTLKSTKTGQTRDLAVGGVFVAVGHDPNTKLFAGQGEDGRRRVHSDKEEHPDQRGGRLCRRRRPRPQVPSGRYCSGFGCMAGIDVNNFLTENS